MTHVIVCQGFSAAPTKNISGTEEPSVSRSAEPVNPAASSGYESARDECVFVVREAAGGTGPFCGLPALPGSAYCARHRPLCVVSSGSAAGRAIAEALAAEAEAPEPPRELRHLQPRALPEPQAEERPEELRSLLDHPPPARGSELPE